MLDRLPHNLASVQIGAAFLQLCQHLHGDAALAALLCHHGFGRSGDELLVCQLAVRTGDLALHPQDFLVDARPFFVQIHQGSERDKRFRALAHQMDETLRKMCCDADLIPIVLGTETQPLDHGRVVRLFTRAQRRAIWRRDKTCTYPGCGAPGAWTNVHHLHHWADGGRSNLDNAALLCQRHHTYVHTKRLWAEVHDRPDETGRYVHWDLTPGSYDRELHRLNSASRGHTA